MITLSHTKQTLEFYKQAAEHYNTCSDLQSVARVDRSTWQRWTRGISEAPAATLELLRLHAFGEPPSGFNNLDWQGWRFIKGALINNDYGYSFTPYDLKAIIYWQPMANRLQAENNALRQRIENAQRYRTQPPMVRYA